jgi:xanthine dehydrogenase accessory factor
LAVLESLKPYLDEERPVVLATVVSGPSESLGHKMLISGTGSTEFDLGVPELSQQVREYALKLLHEERSETCSYETGGETYEIFFDVFPAPARLVIVGAGHVAETLAHFAKHLGYRVIVSDARGAFARAERYPGIDEVIKGWPQDVLPKIRLDDRTFVVLLSHDPKFDEPALDVALRSDVPYVGAIGSRKTQLERQERLRDLGFSGEELTKLHGPVGLDLGGRSAPEIALAILAEITAVRYGKAAGFRSKPGG